MGTRQLFSIAIMMQQTSYSAPVETFQYQDSGFNPFYIQRFSRASHERASPMPANMSIVIAPEIVDTVEKYRGVLTFENMVDYNVPVHQASVYAYDTLPKALKSFEAKKDNMSSHVLKDVTFKPDTKANMWLMVDEDNATERTGTIYVLGQQDMLEDIEIFARAEAADLTIRNDLMRTDVPTKLSTALHAKGSNKEKICGWFDINNQFMLFTCRELFQETAHALGIQTVYDEAKQFSLSQPYIQGP